MRAFSTLCSWSPIVTKQYTSWIYMPIHVSRLYFNTLFVVTHPPDANDARPYTTWYTHRLFIFLPIYKSSNSLPPLVACACRTTTAWAPLQRWVPPISGRMSSSMILMLAMMVRIYSGLSSFYYPHLTYTYLSNDITHIHACTFRGTPSRWRCCGRATTWIDGCRED